MEEQLVALCPKCKCCLADKRDRHCWTCHTTNEINVLCGDGLCQEKMADYIERVRMQKRTQFKRKIDA